jgi:hypothetical protein
MLPEPLAIPRSFTAADFPTIAVPLLNRIDLLVGGDDYRIAEVEAYLHSVDHADPFTHRKPIQRDFGRWYFHRQGESYRGGTFKGLDLTLGDGQATLGILIRSIVAPDDTLIDGPCLVVHHLLSRTGMPSVKALDEAIAGRPVWDTASPLAMRESSCPRSAPVFRTARVGLSLKRSALKVEGPRFIGLPYRFLTEPRRIAKGKAQLIAALHAEGRSEAAIAALTGTPRSAIARYLAAFERGKSANDFAEYYEMDWSAELLCRLLGTWNSRFEEFNCRRARSAAPSQATGAAQDA